MSWYQDVYLQSEHWKTLRAEALEFAQDHCQICYGASDLEVHHRTYERLGNEWPTDLTVLCQQCHQRFHEVMQPAPTRTPEPDPLLSPAERREYELRQWARRDGFNVERLREWLSRDPGRWWNNLSVLRAEIAAMREESAAEEGLPF